MPFINHVTLNSKCKKDGDLVRIDNHFHSSSLRCLFVGNHGQHYSVFYALLPLQWLLDWALPASPFPWQRRSKTLPSSLIFRKLIRPLLLLLLFLLLNQLDFLLIIQQQHHRPTESSNCLQLGMLVLVHLESRHKTNIKSRLYYMVDELLDHNH